MGSPEDLAAALHIVERNGPSLGLHLNRSKSLLFIPEEVVASNSPLPSDIPITRCGFCLLGPPDYCEEVFTDRIARVRVSLVALRDMGDSQPETTLLRSCLALPKVSFILRICPPMEEEGKGAKFLPSILEDSCHVLKAEGLTEVDGDQDVYQFVPQGKKALHASFHLDHSYTQIWMCGRDQKKGLLHIFTYYDDQPGFHVRMYCMYKLLTIKY